MQPHLFSPEGLAALAETMRARPLLAFDFDGTLAPIVERPAEAGVPPIVRERLERLAARLPVAIVTGREVADVTPRLGFAPGFIVGNHGAEDPAAGTSTEDGRALDPLRARLRAAADDFAAAGVAVEDKRISLALHYRTAPDPGRARGLIDSMLAAAGGLKVFGGKCVVNVTAANAPDKADAVAGLVRRSGASTAFFAGDDVNDEVVFVRGEPHWLTVKIGRDDPESKARFVLDGSDEIGTMLQRMLDLSA